MKKEFKPTGSSFKAMSNGDEGFLMGAIKSAPKCGCTITGNATLPHPLEIKYCPQHAATPELYSMLEALIEWNEGVDGGGDGITAEDWQSVKALILKAKGAQ